MQRCPPRLWLPVLLAAACGPSGAEKADPVDGPPDSAADSSPPDARCAPVTVSEAQAWLPGDLPALDRTKGLVGVAIADLDGDDWLDLVFVTMTATTFLYNDGSGTLVAGAAPPIDLPTGWPGAHAVAAVDLEQDGDWDLYLGTSGDTPDLVAWNEGGTFRTEALPDSAGAAFSGHFADADADGDLDLVVANAYWDVEAEDVVAGRVRGDENRFYIQEDGRFTNATARLPADSLDGLTFQVAWLDADTDGDLDLYVANDAGPWVSPNHLLLNDGTGHFTSAADCGCQLEMYAMGTALGDVEGDGDPDLYITDVGGPNLLVNDGAGTFHDATLAAGADIPPTAENMTSWGTTFVDLDRDRCGDLAVVYGVSGSNADYVSALDPTWEDGIEQADVLLAGDCAGGFQRRDDWGFGDRERGRSVAVGDLDRDGRPDLVTAGKPFLRVWRTEGGCDHGLRVRPAVGTQAIGARLEVEVAGDVRTEWMLPWTASSSSAHEWTVGLGTAEIADRVTVTWPDGRSATLTQVASGSDLVVAPD